MTDLRSPLVAKILAANPSAYQALVVRGGTPALADDLLGGISAGDLVTVPGKTHAANAMFAGLWLWHDGLDESHRIAQKSSGDRAADATLAFWHAIMHRREGDFSNSKYWYAQAGAHPVIAILANQVGSLVNHLPASKGLLRISVSGWNAPALVDLVEAVEENPGDPDHQAAVELQRLEWRVLFDYCARG
jgi:hypothetical protein